MTTKLEKIQRTRNLQAPISTIQSKMVPFNQTIIINNPNININYHNDNQGSSSKIVGPLSSRGMDNWNLNNNLKQFSQTRQLGFFKGKRHPERNKSNSPYIIHKVKTQDIKSINKIYGGKTMKDTFANFHKNQTFQQMATVEQGEKDTTEALEKIINRHDKTITEKFYQNFNTKKNPRIQLQKNFQTLPTTHLNSHHPNPQSIGKQFRKNRFEVAGDTITSLTQRKPISTIERHTQEQQAEKVQSKMQESDQEENKTNQKMIAPRLIPFQMRKRAFNKTIESINKILLHQTDTYFQRTFGDKVPQAQIQLFVNSLNQPQLTRPSKQRSSQRSFNQFGEYDFQFEEQRKKRPRTPKRKKPYQQTQ